MATPSGIELPPNLKVAIPTLVGSSLSCIATSCVLVSWVFLGRGKRSFRYALVLNLTFAEWLNSLNNTVSGIYRMMHVGDRVPGDSCTLNGWIGQLSVQAADFSILAIAVVTILTIKLKSYILDATFDKKILICISIWIVPLSTATAAVVMHQIAPVSGNWCWISGEKPYLRYALGHAWRFGIIIITVVIYAYVFFYMRKRFRYIEETISTGSYDYGRSFHHELAVVPPPSPNRLDTKHVHLGTNLSNTITNTSSSTSHARRIKHRRQQSRSIERDIWRILLLNTYPMLYLILWIPGILNRIMEAAGKDYEWLDVMQCSTQYIGFANAITYGYKEHSRDVAAWMKSLG
ncbi:G protein-coupled glucose receptor regulating Gpa2-domain-containing protein [Phyllosticta capitalensis]|uniref:G protein-coupled glucose receptor regulating Gpa2-domain-containing protein n=1 Tax=Phyllosticta capitalensis TaxID=121624 RepID=A0ABR1YZN7_9PEZI